MVSLEMWYLEDDNVTYRKVGEMRANLSWHRRQEISHLLVREKKKQSMPLIRKFKKMQKLKDISHYTDVATTRSDYFYMFRSANFFFWWGMLDCQTQSLMQSKPQDFVAWTNPGISITKEQPIKDIFYWI